MPLPYVAVAEAAATLVSALERLVLASAVSEGSDVGVAVVESDVARSCPSAFDVCKACHGAIPVPTPRKMTRNKTNAPQTING